MVRNLREALSLNLTYIDPLRTGHATMRGVATTQSGHLVAVSYFKLSLEIYCYFKTFNTPTADPGLVKF